MYQGIQIVVSLTTLPDRIAGLPRLLRSLQSQSLEADHIHVWLCPNYKRLNRSFTVEDLPSQLPEDQRLHVEFVDDWGPITKLYPAVERYANTSTLIVTLDDDRDVPATFLESLVEQTLKAGSVCAFRGRVFRRPFYHRWTRDPSCYRYKRTRFYSCDIEETHGIRVKGPVPIDLVTGTGGIAFPPLTLGRDFIHFWKSHKEQYEKLQNLTDDIWISGYLAMHNIIRYVVPAPPGILATATYQKDSLWSINKNSTNNDESIKVFAQYWG